MINFIKNLFYLCILACALVLALIGIVTALGAITRLLVSAAQHGYHFIPTFL